MSINFFAEQFEPLTKKNTGYIVCGVLINDDGQILMMQEAKYSCYGTWYLPAGRVEPNENLYVRLRHYNFVFDINRSIFRTEDDLVYTNKWNRMVQISVSS